MLAAGIGNVTRALAAAGMAERTVIVFTTDNGGPAQGFNSNMASNWPLRGMKRTLWEGGVRGNGLLWGAGLKKTGYTTCALLFSDLELRAARLSHSSVTPPAPSKAAVGCSSRVGQLS